MGAAIGQSLPIAVGVLSLVAAFSPSAGVLIAARAALGVAGATLMPSLFSLLRVMGGTLIRNTEPHQATSSSAPPSTAPRRSWP